MTIMDYQKFVIIIIKIFFCGHFTGCYFSFESSGCDRRSFSVATTTSFKVLRISSQNLDVVEFYRDTPDASGLKKSHSSRIKLK